MSRIITVRKGLDIRLKGEAEKVILESPIPSTIAIKPTDFPGLVPKLLLKEGENFVLEDHYSYPASNEKINDLLYKISNIQVTQKVTEKKSSHKKFELTEDKSQIRVSGFDRTGSKTFDFLVGKKKRFNGNFIRFADKDPVYLSDKALYISGEKDAYIESDLINLEEKDFSEMSLATASKKLIFVKKWEEMFFKSAGSEVALNKEKKKSTYDNR